MTWGEIEPEGLFDLLGDRRPAEEDEIPETGLPPDWERALSAPFVMHERYGTRCSTLLFVERSGETVMHERRFDVEGRQTGTTRISFRSADTPERWFENESPEDALPVDSSFDTSPE